MTRKNVELDGVVHALSEPSRRNRHDTTRCDVCQACDGKYFIDVDRDTTCWLCAAREPAR